MSPIYCEEDMQESPNPKHKSFEIEHHHLYDADPILLCGGAEERSGGHATYPSRLFLNYEKGL